jgi:hypothetical protein
MEPTTYMALVSYLVESFLERAAVKRYGWSRLAGES